MGWETSTRRARLPDDWSRRRAIVKRRANGRCEGLTFAGEPRWHVEACDGRGTDCDHIIEGDDHSLANLQWLSGACHSHKTARSVPAWRRSRETPPGLIG